ncbi:MAG: hypothetical protein HZA00_01085 [Nitrospinae bacterium]|nr:hypothetical protein [Nitrospinota bacterium]
MGVTYLALDSFFAEEVPIIMSDVGDKLSEKAKRFGKKLAIPTHLIPTLPNGLPEPGFKFFAPSFADIEKAEGKEELLREISIEVLKKLLIIKEDMSEDEVDLDAKQFFSDLKAGKFPYSKEYKGVDWDSYLKDASLQKEASKRKKKFDAIEI